MKHKLSKIAQDVESDALADDEIELDSLWGTNANQVSEQDTPHSDAHDDNHQQTDETDTKSVFHPSDQGSDDQGFNRDIVSVTEDFAMQNVLKQMGLVVCAPNGYMIKEVRVTGFICDACKHITRYVPDPMFCPMCGLMASLYRIPMQYDEESNCMQFPSNYLKHGKLAVSQKQVLGLAARGPRALKMRGTPRRKNLLPIACLPKSQGGRFDPGYVRRTADMHPPRKPKEKTPRHRFTPVQLTQDVAG
eukprot:CAMPEP_0197522208 /NCGR_PEP_ID=MMETSP1318-20131121/7392_1 /TAXON_ID=552666 /ORGANISM="Partenskyella glossopodia, Strain RCC365" /LENGTH=247 /DNA_ID=CAMNT_0043074501 /DNA_START=69 /DNA_END=812 /DNA_ORIENTATION=-